MTNIVGKSIRIVTAIAVGVFISCTSDPQGSGIDAGTDTDVDTDTDTDTDTYPDYDSGPDSGPGASLTGKWAQLINVSIIQEVGIPIVTVDQWVVSRNFYLVDITTDGQGNLTAHERLCALKLKLRGCGLELPGNNTSTVNQNFIDHVEVLERHVTVDSDEPGTAWTSDIVYEVRGANLCNGECNPNIDLTCDPIPGNGSANAGDSTPCGGTCTNACCDQDEDGHPGVTNTLTGLLNCETYAAQRWWARLDGQIVDEDTIEGDVVENSSEQTVLAASTPLCGSGSPSTRPENCPEHQYFKMIRLPDNAGCADVLALTDCDEDQFTCDTNEVLPLDPKNDLETDCSPDDCD